MIPLGDLNGDGYGDFVGAIRETTTSTAATVYFGAGTNLGASLERHPFRLVVPKPILTGTSVNGATLSPGDFNGDGIGDIAVGITGFGTAPAPTWSWEERTRSPSSARSRCPSHSPATWITG